MLSNAVYSHFGGLVPKCEGVAPPLWSKTSPGLSVVCEGYELADSNYFWGGQRLAVGIAKRSKPVGRCVIG